MVAAAAAAVVAFVLATRGTSSPERGDGGSSELGSGGPTRATAAVERRGRGRWAGRDPGVAPASPQKRAARIKPRPTRATDDKGKMFNDGCQAAAGQIRNKRCVYGKRNGRKTIALIGDSHALMYFPALNRLAKRQGWKLVAVGKVGCPPFDQLVYNRRVGRGYRECLRWHDYLVKRFRQGKPDLIVTSGWIWHKSVVGGKIVKRTTKRNIRLLRQGYVRLLKRLRRATKAKLVVMKDVPKAPRRIPECVQRNRRRMDRCAFEISANHRRQSFEHGVVKQVARADLVNLAPVFCPERRCHAVIDGRLVYRDNNHLTATYSRTLWNELRDRLPGV